MGDVSERGASRLSLDRLSLFAGGWVEVLLVVHEESIEISHFEFKLTIIINSNEFHLKAGPQIRTNCLNMFFYSNLNLRKY